MAMIDRNFTFATNGTVTANDLHNLIDSATIYQDLITGQLPITSVGTNYELLIADGTNPNAAPNAVTVYDLFEDALTAGTYTNANISAALTYGTATGTRLVSTNATITTGTITTGVIPTLTSSTATFGTTTSTAATITSGTVTNLASTTGTIATLNSTTGTIGTLNSTTGTIGNLSTTLAGDFTISSGTGTLGTSGVTLGTYGGATSVPVLAIDAKGRVTTASTSAITSGLTGFRNRIINGDMRIDQRNAGASSVPATGSYTYTSLDRYFTSVNTPATSTAIRSTSAPATFLYSLKIGRSGSGTAGLNTLGQVIETDNSKDLAGSSVTLSFWARVGASATFSSLDAYVYSGTTTDQSALSLRGGWTGQATVASTTVTLTTTWTKFSFTGAVGSSALQLAAQFVFTTVGAAGADDNLYITGVQLEAGSTATDFERRPIGTELALCYRYLPFFTLSNATIGIIGQASATNIAYYTLPFQNTARTSPTGITLTTGTLSAFTSVLTTAGGTGSFNSAQTTQGQIVVTGATGLVAGNATYLNPSATMTILWTGCEL
jgi:hypothetical protein